MALVNSFHPFSPYSLRKALASGRKGPKLSSTPSFLALSSPFLCQPLPSTSSSPLGNSSANKTSKCRRTPISMSLQMEEAAATDHSSAPPQAESIEIPGVVEITIPPESLVGFEADYERVSKTWPADLSTTTDDAKIEQFVSSAHALVRRWLPQDLVCRLENYMYDPAESAVLVIRGLPIDKELPPTEPDLQIKKQGKHMSETWLVGIARIMGQVFIPDYLRRTGMGMLVRELYSTPDKVNYVGAEGSRELLDIHVDFGQVIPTKFAHIVLFFGIKGDPNKQGKTLLCDNRTLYRKLDPADIEVLRSEKLTWETKMAQFSQYIIEGPESNPRFFIFEENLTGVGGFDETVKASPQAKAAYKRVKKAAALLAEGVYLEGGDVILLNQKKACHGRSPYAPKFDGNDRWLQRIYVNSGFWEAGHTQWPCRSISLF
ncbi:unnamed protein product [Calypogeia fissa]